MGAGEAIIPFLNDDAKRTFSHLFLRPGYMIRDYIRGQHERYLAPFTALLVFYSVFTLLMAIVQPGSLRSSFSDKISAAIDDDDLDVQFNNDQKAEGIIRAIFSTAADAFVITHLDLHPESADTPWKESLAAVEGDLRSKGVPLFLGNFFLLWIAMARLLRKSDISVSGAAAASAYVLCQFCIFMFLALLVSLGKNSEIGVLIMGILLFIDYKQLTGTDNKTAFKLTFKTGLFYVLFFLLFYMIVGTILIIVALNRV